MTKDCPCLAAIILNNLSIINLTEKNYTDTVKYSNRAKKLMEKEINPIFGVIKDNLLALDSRFKKKFTILMIAKLNLSLCLLAKPELNADVNFPDINEFVNSARKESEKYLGSANMVTRKFYKLTDTGSRHIRINS
eukprot:CAMPEP_0114592366 /NCGR_PEP_ID=MMETSP0125-20121206/14211_1 /TAXON_ID=485358 ORGANISM="Aristerostoma sp., Strain ATCC 50986" /NCGR_SAMPLE_ID=MMETSP0125 /ASSEMBLY_ACC=CAM_ASM_000245 /LENGTH=135 /DNA_ID=CAMNT_0001790975 /DNA_START=363 /DNA_END=770 /DNA_ORIENTATION=-